LDRSGGTRQLISVGFFGMIKIP